MAEHAVPPPRRRGRPRGGSDARNRILAAATEEFSENGYDGATMRAIATRAGVDSALVHHYFGTKADLFTEIVGAPIRPDLDIPTLLAGDRARLGEAIVRYILVRFEQPEVRRRGVLLLRNAIGNRLATPLLAAFLSRELLGRITAELGGADAELRASLAASQVAGMLVARYILKLPGIAAASTDELVGWVGPTIQRYLTE
ncbi:TetR family transcriptional regulator [Microbacterium sp. T2.11-28]|uniref:TetR/AcrR family transcriptional regulator n=1 Tax=unclassified Microbacterium TaxID=2609290 RepID=UPI00247747EC|nr:TetR family transcriptional regulator [Microbacterium sp. T2.11-28]CAI9388246.1 HTH-type transcriptional regulator BetI [Microbacterium sp. T2.11-28]